MHDFSNLSLHQLRKELAYQRQFAGVPGVSYHRAYCQEAALTIRQRIAAARTLLNLNVRLTKEHQCLTTYHRT